MMARISYLLREALVNLRRNALVAVGAVVAVALSMGLAFSAVTLNEVLRRTTQAWQDGTHVIAFFKEEADGGLSEDAQLGLANEIRGWPEVKEVVYVDRPTAYQEALQIFSEYGPSFAERVKPESIPTSIRLKLNDIETWRDIEFRLDALQVFQRVVAPGESIDQMSSLTTGLRVLGIGLSLVLAVAAVILIANTIRMAIYARRDEVSIMKLVGASNWFIRVPFVLEGLIEGLIGALVAAFLVWSLFRYGAGRLAGIQLFRFDVPPLFFFQWGFVVVMFGALAGVVGSLIGLSRYLREADGGKTAGATA